MYQQLTIVGYLGNDPVMRFTPSGQAVTSFSVATSRSYTNNAGQKVDETAWFRISVWGAQAESCNQYLSKGRQVLVEGEIRTRQYEDKSGQTRYAWDLVARNVRFLGGRDAPSEVPAGEPPIEQEGEIPF